MSFQIFVVIPQTAIPMPANPRDWEKWARECSKLILLEEPLGSDAMVYRYWSSLAEQLNLTLLASLYQHGLHLEAGRQGDPDHVRAGDPRFEALQAELDLLESYWLAHLVEPFEGEPDEPAGEDSLLEALEERMRHLRRAIQLAIEKRATLFVEQPS